MRGRRIRSWRARCTKETCAGFQRTEFRGRTAALPSSSATAAARRRSSGRRAPRRAYWFRISRPKRSSSSHPPKRRRSEAFSLLPEERTSRLMGAVGRNVPRKEGLDKVTGRAKYVDDLTFPGMLHGRTRSEERRVGKECRSRWSPYH